MIAAVIALAVAVVAAVGGLITFALKGFSAESNLGDAREHEATIAGQLAIANAATETQRSRGDSEKRRADALDDLIAKHAATAAGPVDGAFQRLLQEWAGPGHTAAGGAPGAVPAKPAAATPGPDDLERPGA